MKFYFVSQLDKTKENQIKGKDYVKNVHFDVSDKCGMIEVNHEYPLI